MENEQYVTLWCDFCNTKTAYVPDTNEDNDSYTDSAVVGPGWNVRHGYNGIEFMCPRCQIAENLGEL